MRITKPLTARELMLRKNHHHATSVKQKKGGSLKNPLRMMLGLERILATKTNTRF